MRYNRGEVSAAIPGDVVAGNAEMSGLTARFLGWAMGREFARSPVRTARGQYLRRLPSHIPSGRGFSVEVEIRRARVSGLEVNAFLFIEAQIRGARDVASRQPIRPALVHQRVPIGPLALAQQVI